MSKRGENIHKRKDGRWEARYKIYLNDTNEIKYKSIYGKTYKEVKSKLLEVKNHGEHVVSKTKGDVLFSTVANDWLTHNSISLKPATRYKYQTLINSHINPDIGNVRLYNLTASKINHYLEQKLINGRIDGKGSLSPSYVKTIGIIIKSVIQFAVEEELCEPLKSQILKPSSIKKETPVLNDEEYNSLENYLYSDYSNYSLGVLISLYAGLRIGEVCALRWNDIDFENRLLYVRHTVTRICTNEKSECKTSLVIDKPKTETSYRTIPINIKLYDALCIYKRMSKSEYVISTSDTFLSPRTLEYNFHKILTKSNIKPINFHAIRHTFATRCIQVGMDVKALSEILGHSNVGITLNTYIHTSMDNKRQYIDKIF